MSDLLLIDTWERQCEDFCAAYPSLFETQHDIACFQRMIGFHAHVSSLLKDLDKVSFFQGKTYIYEERTSLSKKEYALHVGVSVDRQQIEKAGISIYSQGFEQWVVPFVAYNRTTIGVKLNDDLFEELSNKGPHYETFHTIKEKVHGLQTYYNNHGQDFSSLWGGAKGKWFIHHKEKSIFLPETREIYPSCDPFLAFLEKTSIVQGLPNKPCTSPRVKKM